MSKFTCRPGLLTALLIILTTELFCQVGYSQSVSDKKPEKQEQKDIRTLLAENKTAANRWWYGWIIGYGAATVTQAGIAMSSPKLSTRQDMWNGTVVTILGLAGTAITPLVPKAGDIDKKMTAENEQGHIYSDSERMSYMLGEIARREQFGRSWKVHAIAAVVNAGSGVVTWVGFKRSFGDGLLTFVLNTAFTEAQIWSQPIRAKRDYANYMNRRQEGKISLSGVPEKHWLFIAGPGGASVRLQF
jgi:hypothetical protein